VHEEQVESKKKRLDLVHPWRANSRESWSVLENIWNCKLESQVFRPKELIPWQVAL
jgi:hypothetical protein